MFRRFFIDNVNARSCIQDSIEFFTTIYALSAYDSSSDGKHFFTSKETFSIITSTTSISIPWLCGPNVYIGSTPVLVFSYSSDRSLRCFMVEVPA